MEHEEIGIKKIGKMQRDEYLRLLAKYTDIDEEKLFQYTKENPIRYIFEYPEALDLTEWQHEKLLGLRRWRQLFESVTELDSRDVIKGPQDIANLCSDLTNELKEHFIMIILNTKNEVVKKTTVSIGNLSSSVVHPREVFKEAIKYSAASVIFIHNHPSGNTVPSGTDIEITKRLVEAGNILGIRALDHIVVGKYGYTSMKQENLIDDKDCCFERLKSDEQYKGIRER